MNIQELATAVAERLPVIVAIMNNGYLGMVRQWQEIFYQRHYSGVCLERDASCEPDCTHPDESCPAYSPDFVRLAEAYGAAGIRVDTEAQIGPALAEAAKNHEAPDIPRLPHRAGSECLAHGPGRRRDPRNDERVRGMG